MSESEQREIKEAAISWAAGHYSNRSDPVDLQAECYIAGATAMAEKKNVEIEEWRTVANTEILLNKFYKKEIDEIKMEAAKVFIDYGNSLEKYKAQLEAAQEELKTMTWRRDHWTNLADTNEKLAERFKKLFEESQTELSRVKEVANIMQSALLHGSEKMTSEALTEFANLMNKEK